MRTYTVHYEDYDWYSEQHIYLVNANSKEEALGFILEHIPNSNISNLEVYGDDVKGADVGIVDCLLNERWEP